MGNFDNDITRLYEKLNVYILRHYDYRVEPQIAEPSPRRSARYKKMSEQAMEEDTASEDEVPVDEDAALDYIAPKKESRESIFDRFLRRQTSKARKCERPETSRIDFSKPNLPGNFNNLVLDRLEDSFGTLLVKTINKKGLVNADVYKDANIDRRLFSKIISNEGYTPTKGTVLALAIALKLNLDETTSLLKSAGYALSHSSKSDIVVEFFISQTDGHYNIDVVNDALEHFNLPTLGSRL